MLYFIFKLYCHLIDLGTLHVFMVDLVSLYNLVVAWILIVFDEIIEHLVSVTKFVYHKFLHANNVYYVE